MKAQVTVTGTVLAPYRATEPAAQPAARRGGHVRAAGGASSGEGLSE